MGFGRISLAFQPVSRQGRSSIARSRATFRRVSCSKGFGRFLHSLPILVGLAQGPARALVFSADSVSGHGFLVARLDVRRDSLRIFWLDSTGHGLGSFRRAQESLEPGRKLVFAVNAGIFDTLREGDSIQRPLGMLVSDGRILSRVNRRRGRGNFYVRPNGVFLVEAGHPRVVEARKVPKHCEKIRLATQSGPLLLMGGRIHPVFDSLSRFREIRNAVGVRGDSVFLAISQDSVNFHQTARLFRDVLHCRNALYLDGAISGIHAPALGRSDTGHVLVPMIGVVERE